MLFSEPKIPQYDTNGDGNDRDERFSALQRAENSSISICDASSMPSSYVSVLFSEPKIPQWIMRYYGFRGENSFSALQRAENSSILSRNCTDTDQSSFSALQRAENSSIPHIIALWKGVKRSFSALQRAENSSIVRGLRTGDREIRVSVLFSEPKIPQLRSRDVAVVEQISFSALQRAENSSICV